MEVTTASLRSRSFEERVAFHQRRAILSDLNELFGESSPISSPDISGRTSHSSSYYHSPPETTPLDQAKICEVQFKFVYRHYALPPALNHIQVGEFVMVQSFYHLNQEDLGIVTKIYPEDKFESLKICEGPHEDADENKVGKILRIASPAERRFLPMKFQRECPLLGACQAFVKDHLLSMSVYGVEYQYDGMVLFVYYRSEYRVDYRPLVKFLFRLHCKGSRIQMKKTNQCRQFTPVPSAAEALVTGKKSS